MATGVSISVRSNFRQASIEAPEIAARAVCDSLSCYMAALLLIKEDNVLENG
jgi:hypothetical protein